MNLAFTHTRSAIGIHAQPVSVEIHLSNSVPGFSIVGLPETAVKESKDRVRSAIMNSRFEFPCRRITVNLAPADLPKAGSGFDLPIAIGILAASGQIPDFKLGSHEFIGELGLNGEIRGVSAIIPVVLAVHKDDRMLVISTQNAHEAALTKPQHVLAAANLSEVCNYLCQDTPLHNLPDLPPPKTSKFSMDWSDVKGQRHAKQALEIAASGGHSVLMSGAPGSGKTMLAQRFTTLLPPLNETQALECAAIKSLRGKNPDYSTWLYPPFRAPHHTASQVALVGGGNPPKPGEISLAHHGVLFLDELPEFSRHALETLREPLETGVVCISRAALQTEFPASFQLISAMNPCPCGHWGNPQGSCICSPERISRYLAKLSAPLLDRIDMMLSLQALSKEELVKPHEGCVELSAKIRDEVQVTRARQLSRQGCLNAQLGAKESESLCQLSSEERAFLAKALDTLKLSARAYHRLLKVARTIADMNQEEKVGVRQLQQALSYKQVLHRP